MTLLAIIYSAIYYALNIYIYFEKKRLNNTAHNNNFKFYISFYKYKISFDCYAYNML